MTVCPSLLENLHPDGAARRATVLGSGCPERLRPDLPVAGNAWDLVVVAPSQAEGRSVQWIAGAARDASRDLDPDGLVYVMAGVRARRRITQALEAEGLQETASVAHLPDHAASEVLVPLTPKAIRAAAARMHRPWTRGLLRGLLAAPALATVAGSLYRSVGVIARRPGARPLAMWLEGADDGAGIGSIRTRWRADRVRTVVHIIAGKGAFVKLERSGTGMDALRREAAALAQLGPAARASGARTPDAVLVEASPACPALRLTQLDGDTARSVLARMPSRRDEILRTVGGWLEAWSRSTSRLERIDEKGLEHRVLGPARRLQGAFQNGAQYVVWLEARCRELVGRAVPMVAAHNDLTMANLLLTDGDAPGVLDWEAATPDGLPLADFVYAAVDATAAGGGYRDRPAAFDACFGSAGTGTVGEILVRLRRAVELPDAWATLAFHACWLQHAENERRKRAPGEPLPFLDCARRAASLRWQA